MKFNHSSKCLLLLGALALSGCHKINTDSNTPLTPGNYHVGEFDFATTTEVNLSVNYGIAYPILFEVYIQNPMILNNGVEVKDSSLEPAFRAITDDKGSFTGTMNLPTYAKEVYIYTKYMGVPTCANVKLNGSSLVFDLAAASGAGAKGASVSRAGEIIGGSYFKVIDSWDADGRPLHMLPRRTLSGDLIGNIMYTLPESNRGVWATGDPYKLIKEDEAIGDIKLVKNTKVNLLFMHEGASMRNTLAYYCYPTANPPKSVDELTRVIAIPNFSYAYSGGSLSSGDCVQLKYWNGQEFVEEFPAGTTIGWCIITSSFDVNTGNINTKKDTYYSNPIFNPENVRKQHCVALYDKNKKVIALGFEDQNRERMYNGSLVSDQDFNDLVFYIETSEGESIDANGIPEIVPNPSPAPAPEDNYIVYSGSLAFEDLWPTQGDYDMNDVVIDYECTHYRNSKNQIVKIVDKFIPKWSRASRHNGFGYQLGVYGTQVYSVKVESDYENSLSFFKTDGKGLELNQNYATIMLFEDMKKLTAQHTTELNTTKAFTVTIEFTSPVTLNNVTVPPYNAFMVANSGDAANPQRGIEVHLPNKAPTSLADKSKLGTGLDASNPDKGVYYISKDNFMFALNLPVAFNFPDEGQRIDEAYGRYSAWVLSGGKTDADWYLDAKK